MAGVIIALAVFLYRYMFIAEHVVTSQETKPLDVSGNARDCMESKVSNLEIFDVLPGGGWDNLRNVHTGLILSYNYSQCRTTADGRFLIPDFANMIPLKQTKVESFSEIINNWTQYTSVTCQNINSDPGLNLPQARISGHFSSDFQQTKKQISDKSFMTRTQLRYVRYKTTLQPDSPLHPSFKHRLFSIASKLQTNETAQAQYECEILIRDFGTHVVTSVDAGLAIVQQDQVDPYFISKYGRSKTMFASAASASFVCYDSMHNMTGLVQEYRNSRTASTVLSYGGQLFFNANCLNWSVIENDLVAIDRSGEPIVSLITPTNLPELSAATVYYLHQLLSKTVELYYEYNTYRGCTQLNSPNFSPLTNLDDGSCKTETTDMNMFGGVFQTCSNDEAMCNELELSQVNPKTGQHSCPKHYQAVILHEASFVKSSNKTSCRSCWLFWTCCHTETRYSRAKYAMYWCAAQGPVAEDSGYMFGGIFTNHLANPVTGEHTCPNRFYARQLSTDLFVCISDDFKQGREYSVPFAGFFSCDVGNPLNLEVQQCGGLDKDTPPLTLFYQNSDLSNWAKKCPEGFSKHLAYVVMQCSIYYCAKTNLLIKTKLSTVRRPPFVGIPIDGRFPELKMWIEKKNPISYETVVITEEKGISWYVWGIAMAIGIIVAIMLCLCCLKH